MEEKMLSIAPSFNCSLKCEGCYLTTGVTKLMRDSVKSDYYWERAFELAIQNGYEQLAMTLNPYPGAEEVTLRHIAMARKAGFKTIGVTTVQECMTTKLIDAIDILTISWDDMRYDSASAIREDPRRSCEIDNMWTYVWDQGNDEYEAGRYDDEGKLVRQFHLNINLLWTPGVFENWLDDPEFKRAMDYMLDDGGALNMTISLTHLLYKPFSLYQGKKWFNKMIKKVERAGIPILGDGSQHIGDPAYLRNLNIVEPVCANMLDIDPMGFARRCPENPKAVNASTLDRLERVMKNGIPACGDKCNCVTE